MCQAIIIFGTLKDSSFQINSYTSNNSATEMSSKMASTCYWKYFLNPGLSNLKLLCCSDHIILFKFHQHVVQIFLRKLWRHFRLLMSALATVTWKSFNGKFTRKNWFSDQVFCVAIADADIGSLESLHTPYIYFVSILTICWWNLNKIVWTKLHKILSFLTKNG